MSIGSNIRDARLRLNLTQEELASMIGVTKNAISNYENGVSTPKFELLDSLMSSLHLDANTLFDCSSDQLGQPFSPVLSKQLQQARDAAKIPVECVSEYLASRGYTVPVKTINAYENGTARPSVEVFLFLCDYYRITDVLGTFRIAPKRLFNPGEQITLLREYLNLSVASLAAILNTTPHAIKMYESGKSKLPMDVISAITSKFDIPETFFHAHQPSWDYDIFEDFTRARDDAEAMSIIKENGLDPRAYDEFFRILATRNRVTVPFQLTDEERNLVIAYRSHPSMQESVRKLIDVPSTSSAVSAS